MDIPHTPVLLKEVVESFRETRSGYIVDCTLGYGGHSEALLKAYPDIKLICIDQDIEALDFSKRRLKKYHDRVIFIEDRFSHAITNLKEYDIKGILADIGVSSLQLDKSDRGFRFDSNILDMRMNKRAKLDASYVVNFYSQSDLERVFREYGEIREYKKLASLITQNRPFNSSSDLSSFIVKHFKGGKIHPATLAFQAVRIEVNNELGELRNLLKNIKDLNLSNAIVAIISFHSLEDRIVKEIFKEWARNCICPVEAFRCECGNNHAIGKILTKKPIVPTKEEINDNPRSRSSKLRLFRLF